MEKATSDSTTTVTAGNNPVKGRIIAIRQNPIEEQVELYQDVHIVGPEKGAGFAQMFGRAKCTKSKKGVQDADLVVFTGGSMDIHPLLYGADPNMSHDMMYFESQQCIDTMMEYIEVWQECFYTGTPMVGVCLGAQFLHVMNGGKLYQHIDNHNSCHSMWDTANEETIQEISSVHHQACIENDEMEVLGVSCESNERWRDRTQCELVIDKPDVDDIEAFFYRDTMSIGFQGHPEYNGYPEYTQWCLRQIQHKVIDCPDLKLINNLNRVKEEVLRRRNFTLPESVHNFIKEYS